MFFDAVHVRENCNGNAGRCPVNRRAQYPYDFNVLGDVGELSLAAQGLIRQRAVKLLTSLSPD